MMHGTGAVEDDDVSSHSSSSWSNRWNPQKSYHHQQQQQQQQQQNHLPPVHESKVYDHGSPYEYGEESTVGGFAPNSARPTAQSTHEALGGNRSPRAIYWFTFFLISIITLGSSMEAVSATLRFFFHFHMHHYL